MEDSRGKVNLINPKKIARDTRVSIEEYMATINIDAIISDSLLKTYQSDTSTVYIIIYIYIYRNI